MTTRSSNEPTRRARTALAWIAALALAALGCASAAPKAADTTTTAETRPKVVSLRVGTSGNYPPFSAGNDDGGEGFAGALLGAFAKEERIELAWERFRWPDLVGDLRAGRFDLAADGITVRPERSVAGRFTVPVARGGAVLLVRRPAWAPPAAGGSAIDAARALDRPEMRVAVNRGGHLERVTRTVLHGAQIVAVAENGAVPGALARGEVDGVMTNTFEAPRWVQGLPGVEIIGPLTRDVVALYVRADRPDLAARLDDWLLAAEQSGALERLRARHLGPGGGGPTARPVNAILCATAERLALMPLVAAAKQRLGQAVDDPAQETRVIEAARREVVRAAAARGVEPPRAEIIDAFFRAQMEAAKAVQRRVPVSVGAPAFSLESDLRPAIARITSRLAALLVRVPRGITAASIMAEAREDLADSGLDAGDIARLAGSLAAFAE